MLKIITFTGFTMLLCLKNKWAENTISLFTATFLCITLSVNKMSNIMWGCTISSDILSYTLIMLSLWLTALMIIASTAVKRHNFKPIWFLSLVNILCFLLIFTFLVTNVFLFYLLFESTLIPILMLIMGWGYQPERIQAGVYLLFYTLIVSLPLLLTIFWLKGSMGTLNIHLLQLFWLNPMKFWTTLALVGAFLVKMPMFTVHLWLPKAHVEAPVSGSMILAGVLLKLGGYGLIRLSPLFYNKFPCVNLVWITVSMIGGAVVSFICLRQTDMKSLVAYSSVAHMGLVIAGIMIGSVTGALGSLTLMIAHGLCSSGMFCLTNIVYERLSTRNLMICKGLIQIMPSMCMWWFLICICNMAAPPSINLAGEILLINSICSWALWLIPPLMIMSFMSAAFTLYLFSFTQHGMPNSSIYSFSAGAINEYTLLLLHWVPINLMIVKAEIFIM
uniref:NADH-ubiquinone oxidoreductase chain 4 n=1 Tax=Takobia yixiani TaxID=743459 RepID=X1W3D3_9INSE|nr:NADH dehydrogenase subunit 4 [Takobia yixiani]